MFGSGHLEPALPMELEDSKEVLPKF